ncbi:ABC transporter ATP-binding protein [Cellulomonas timonensis]|uniref:ABC transporter ATP-binding protein n=1 Tax=Cellulomonas timonensis TaxID=1689271 RepID=UPI000832A466|nr:ATP-binding cassette domain-containing protein [Cellulomonas timonensis]
MPSEHIAVLRARALHVGIDGRHLLRGVDLDLVPGDLHVVVGRSGAGKTLLIRALTGALPRGSQVAGAARLGVDHGAVDLLGADAATFAGTVYGRLVGVVPQSAATSFTPVRTLRVQLTEAVVALGAASGRLLPGHPHLTRETVRRHVDELAATAGLDVDLLDRYPHQVSGGQIRRAAVAAALAGHPPLLLADEPASGLDEDAGALLAQMLRTYTRSGHAALLVTHDVELARAYGDTLSVMADGQVVERGPARAVLDDPVHAVTRALVRARRGGLRPGPRAASDAVDVPDAVRLRGVAAGYGRVPVLTDVDLTVRPGEVVGVAGPSGSGKSTLAAVAALMHPPDAGSVQIAGQDVRAVGARVPAALRRSVGWVQQEPRAAMDPRLTLRRSITLPQRLADWPHGSSPDPVADLAAAVGLAADLLDRRPAQVSGGELQRAAVARALGLRPALLVCDEITAMLDAAAAAELVALVARLARERGVGVLLVSHDVTLLRAHADVVAVVRDGRVTAPETSGVGT